MIVYRVKNEYLGSDVVWDNWQDAIEEIKSFFLWGDESTEPGTITLTTEKMSQSKFESLPEFEGY